MSPLRPTDSLIAEIYEAALEPCGWEAVLTKISDQLNGAAIITDTRSTPDGLPVALFSTRFNVEQLLVSIEDFGEPGTNPVFDHVRDTSNVGSFFERRQVLDDHSFERNTVSRAILFPQGLYEASACALDRRPDRLSVMALARARSKGAFDDDEFRYLDGVSGHLKRSLELTARAQENNIANHRIEAIVESLPQSAIALDASWRVLGANAPASALLSSGALFDYQNGSIALADDKQQERLQACMESSNAGATGAPDQQWQCLATARKRPNKLYQLSVLRSDRPTTNFSAGRTLYLLLIHPVDTINPQVESLIRDCFELTRSEARLAITLATVGTLEETLARLAITRNTAKTHLRRIFDKTATRNQVELVRLIATLQAV